MGLEDQVLDELSPTAGELCIGGIPTSVLAARFGTPLYAYDAEVARRALIDDGRVGDRLATTIVMRTLCWPDAFPATDPLLLRAAAVRTPGALLARAETWRPWRAYAAMHLRLHGEAG